MGFTMKKFNILHIAPAPLVGSPGKISELTDLYFNSSCIIFKDYPSPLQGLFSKNVIMLNDFKEFSIQLIKHADIIHIHNFLTKEQEEIILTHSKTTTKFIYQVHSPLREGPLFSEYVNGSKINYEYKLVIAQYHPRLYPDYIIVPNLIVYPPNIKLLKENEIPKVIFTPSHKRTGGRWNDKVSKELEEVLESLKKLKLIDIINLSNVSPYTAYQIRKECHITIDEISTGSYHQVSLEGLCAGNVVINNSDVFSNSMLMKIAQNNEVPFYKVNKFDIHERLLYLVQNKDLIRELQQKSFNFYKDYLTPDKLIHYYLNIYKELLK